MQEIHWPTFLDSYVRGTRQFVFKEDLSTLSDSRRQLRRLYWVDKTVQVGGYCLLSTVCCLLSTVYCLLSTVYCLLSTVLKPTSICLLSTVQSVYCLLFTMCHLLSTVLLPSAYCIQNKILCVTNLMS